MSTETIGAKLFAIREAERKQLILDCLQRLRGAGVPEEALSSIKEYAESILCEGCGAAPTSGPHGPDSVYLCEECQ